MLELIGHGFIDVLHPYPLAVLFIGTVLGLFVGALPGLSSPMAIVVLIPLTYGMEPLPALLILIGVYVATKLGGSFSAILLRTPGTPAAACTALDGHPMAEKGQAGLALGYSTAASTLGGLFGWVIAIIFAPLISLVAVKATNADISMIALVGLILVASLSRGSMLQGMIGVMLGLLVSTIGMDPISGFGRLTFGHSELLGGIPFIPAMIGLFGVTVVLSDLKKLGSRRRAQVTMQTRLEMPKVRDLVKVWREMLVGSLFGIGIGIIPGIGAVGATWMSYSTVKNQSKHPEKFGTGIPEGIAAPESANNAVTGGTMIPMLTLGIPGDPSTAIMLGALLLHGLNPGPLLFKNSPQIVYGVLAGLFFANIFMFLVAWKSLGVFVKVLTKDRSWLFPFILVLGLIGAFATSNTVFAIYVALVFGILGYFLESFGFPVAPVVLALLLGPIIEENMRLALVLSRGSWWTFLSSWPAGISVLIGVLMIIREIRNGIKQSQNKATAA